jgi:hypothetical protein
MERPSDGHEGSGAEAPRKEMKPTVVVPVRCNGSGFHFTGSQFTWFSLSPVLSSPARIHCLPCVIAPSSGAITVIVSDASMLQRLHRDAFEPRSQVWPHGASKCARAVSATRTLPRRCRQHGTTVSLAIRNAKRETIFFALGVFAASPSRRPLSMPDNVWRTYAAKTAKSAA